MDQQVKPKVFFAGFEDGNQVTGWDRRRDRIYSTMRRRSRERKQPMEIRAQVFLEKR